MSGGVGIGNFPTQTLNLSDPVLSLIRMTLQVVIHALLAPVEAHGVNLRGTALKTTAKPHRTAALQSPALSD